jgi:polygalacturonase
VSEPIERVDLVTTAQVTNLVEETVSGVIGEVTGGGVTDHGALTGLADNDHPQYSLTDHSHAAAPSASTTVAGLVELATNAETTTGTDSTRAVTPAGLKAVTDALPSSGDLSAFAIFRPEDYGAVGDNTTNDGPAIQAAVNAAAAAGGGKVWLSEATYYTTQRIQVTASNVTIEGCGRGLSKIRHNIAVTGDAKYAVLDFRGSIPAFGSPTATLTANVALPGAGVSHAQASTVTVASSTGIAAGDVVMVGDNNTEYTWSNAGWTNRYRGEMVRVASVTSTTITFTTPLRSTYATASSAGVWKPTLLRNVGVRNIGIYCASGDTTDAGGIYFDLCRDAFATGLDIGDLDHFGIKIDRTYQSLVDDCTIHDLPDAGSLLGYGVILQGTEGAVISNSQFHKVRHGVTTGGITSHVGWTRNTLVTGCIATECTNTGFDTHAWTTDFTFVACRSERNLNGGFAIRSERTNMLACSTSGNTNAGVLISDQMAKKVVVQGNHFAGDLYGLQISGGGTDGVPSDVTFSNNVVHTSRYAGVLFNSAAAGFKALRNTFVDVNIGGSGTNDRDAIRINSGITMTEGVFLDNLAVGANSVLTFPSTATGIIATGNRLQASVGTTPAPVKPGAGAAAASDPYAPIIRPSGGASGQALLLDADLLPVWGDAGGGSSIDATTLQLIDDFLSGSANTGAQIGVLGWNAANLTSGNGSNTQITGVAGHPGILQVSSGTVAGGLRAIYLTPSPTVLADEYTSVTWYIRPTQVDTDTRIRIGFVGNSAGDPSAHGAYFEKAYADTNWFAVTRNGTTEGRTDTGVAVTAGTWYKLRVRKVPATSNYGFTINAGTEATRTTVLPGAGSAWNPSAQIGSQTTTAKTLDLDRFEGVLSGLAR